MTWELQPLTSDQQLAGGKVRAATTRKIRAALCLAHGPWCRLCGEGIDMDLDGTCDPWAPSLDHTIALADGGTNVPANWQLAHRKCNESKSSEIAAVRNARLHEITVAWKAARQEDDQWVARRRRKMKQEIHLRRLAYAAAHHPPRERPLTRVRPP